MRREWPKVDGIPFLREVLETLRDLKVKVRAQNEMRVRTAPSTKTFDWAIEVNASIGLSPTTARLHPACAMQQPNHPITVPTALSPLMLLESTCTGPPQCYCKELQHASMFTHTHYKPQTNQPSPHLESHTTTQSSPPHSQTQPFALYHEHGIPELTCHHFVANELHTTCNNPKRH